MDRSISAFGRYSSTSPVELCAPSAGIKPLGN
jgi:hypothetical protein